MQPLGDLGQQNPGLGGSSLHPGPVLPQENDHNAASLLLHPFFPFLFAICFKYNTKAPKSASFGVQSDPQSH